MLMMRTGTVTVTGYDTYKNDDGNGPMTRRDGSAVEFVSFLVEGEERARQLTLDGSVNGSRVDVGSRAELLLESRQSESAEIGRSGRPYIKRTVKFRVTGFEPVAAGK